MAGIAKEPSALSALLPRADPTGSPARPSLMRTVNCDDIGSEGLMTSLGVVFSRGPRAKCEDDAAPPRSRSGPERSCFEL